MVYKSLIHSHGKKKYELNGKTFDVKKTFFRHTQRLNKNIDFMWLQLDCFIHGNQSDDDFPIMVDDNFCFFQVKCFKLSFSINAELYKSRIKLGENRTNVWCKSFLKLSGTSFTMVLFVIKISITVSFEISVIIK